MFSNELDIKFRKLDCSREDEFELAVAVMTESFSVSKSQRAILVLNELMSVPTWSHFYREGDASIARAKVLYYLRAVAEVGELWATERGEEKVVESVIAFNPPGKTYAEASTVSSDREALNRLLGSTLTSNEGGKVLFTSTNVDVDAVVSSSWNITLIGTIPSASGKGLGSKLIQLVLDRSGEDGKGVWVPTTFEPRKRFYEKLGFELIKAIRNTNDLGEEAFEYIMYRGPG